MMLIMIIIVISGILIFVFMVLLLKCFFKIVNPMCMYTVNITKLVKYTYAVNCIVFETDILFLELALYYTISDL